jgi:hypothetical protein
MFYCFEDDVFQGLFNAFKYFILGKFFFVFRFRLGSCSCCCYWCEFCWVDAWVGWCVECYSSYPKVLGCIDNESRISMISSA